ncbi:MAG: hypothetical protein ACR2FY_14410 [Pirellulaceae bacterium]
MAALVIAHLGLACLATVVESWQRPYGFNDWWEYVRRQSLSGFLFGFLIGQLTLLATWGAFADQPWFLRIPRFLALTAWSLVFMFLGEYLAEGVSAKRLVEEYSAYPLLLLTSPVVVLFSIRASRGRRFMHHDSEQGQSVWQFSTRRLLLVTSELAAFLAIGRIVLPASFSRAEFWAALTGHRIEEILPAFVSVTVLPVLLIGIARQQTWQRHLAIGLYFLLPSLVLALGQNPYYSYAFGRNPAWEWWPRLGIELLNYFWVHACAAATILFTFWLLRRIGYDFRRRDDGPLGRNSSNARSSAASASA